MQFKNDQELFEIKKKEKDTQAEIQVSRIHHTDWYAKKCPFNFIIQGGMVAVKNLTAKQNKLDEQALKQQELLYNQVCGNRVTKM